MAVTVSAVSDRAAAGLFSISQHNTQIKCVRSAQEPSSQQRPADRLLSGSLKVGGEVGGGGGACVCTTCLVQKNPTTTKQPVVVKDNSVNENTNMRLLMDQESTLLSSTVEC